LNRYIGSYPQKLKFFVEYQRISSMLDIKTIPVSSFMQNARILGCSVTRDAVVVDPGGDPDLILEALESGSYNCSRIWLTHSHLDHAGGAAELKQALNAEMYAHPVEKFMRENVTQVAAMYGLSEGFNNCPEPEHYISGGETLKIGQYEFKVLFTPGHSPGHVSFYCEQESVLIAGDALFAGSIGRTDLPGGDYETLLQSIRQEILTLPADTIVMPGHGPDTSVGVEKDSNPFLTGT